MTHDTSQLSVISTENKSKYLLATIQYLLFHNDLLSRAWFVVLKRRGKHVFCPLELLFYWRVLWINKDRWQAPTRWAFSSQDSMDSKGEKPSSK